MTKKEDSSQVTLAQKLARPVSWQAFVDVMTHELRFAGAGKRQGRDFADLDGEAEKLLGEARREAVRRGVPVAQVLSSMGMLPQNEPSSGNVNRHQLLHQLGWESLSGEWKAFSETDLPSLNALQPVVDGPPTGGAPTGGAPPTAVQLLDEVVCLRRLQKALPPITIDELASLLERLSAEDDLFSDQLSVCKVIPAAQLEEAKAAAQYGPYWLLLLSCGADPERLAALLCSLPWFPLIHEEKGDIADHLAEEGLLSFRQFKSYMEQRKREGESTAAMLKALINDPQLDFSALIARYFEVEVLSDTSGYPPFSGGLPTTLLAPLRVFELAPLSLEEPHIFGGLRPLTSLQRELLEEAVGNFGFFLIHEDDCKARRQLLRSQLASSRHADARQKAREIGAIREMITNTSAVRLVENMLEKALEVGATDVHLEHQEGTFRIRYRIDSILQEAMSVHPELAEEVVSRIKILAGMNITERRKPQDGHIKVSIGGRDVNMRVATLPTYRGERISIRLLNTGQVKLSLEDIGMEGADLEGLAELTERPYGMILTTGPVGSGKTTTLYSSLTRLNTPERNILTIEDPVEYELDGINQIEVNYRIDFGFVEGLRACLRHDPNTILVGEIRDHETAAIAIRAAMTGLLVFSSLHTNDAVGAITTFYNFNIQPMLIANSLLGVVAQRLVRRLCPDCREEYEATAPEIELYKSRNMLKEDETSFTLARAIGCQNCYYTGYQGRLGIFELMKITPEIRALIMAQAAEQDILDAALANGMTMLAQDGLNKARAHRTSIEEIRRVVFL